MELKISDTYQCNPLEKMKEIAEQMFASSVDNSNTDFVIDLDSVWKWIGFSTKSNAKRLLEKQFVIDNDYIRRLDIQQDKYSPLTCSALILFVFVQWSILRLSICDVIVIVAQK